MAKRKAARARKTPRTAKKTAGRRSAKPASRKTAARKTAARKTAARKATARKSAAKKTPARKAVARKRPAAKSKAAAPRRSAPPSRSKKAAPVARKAPSLNRARRVVTEDEDIVQTTPPSSLDLDRSASAVRTGRRSLSNRFNEHTETSPAMTGGDVDADWESAYSVGDEAPGGDNPTPDQDIVDDIGKAVGIEYQDNEELKGAKKVEQRDKKRWELDPASSDDWDDR